MEQTKDIRAKRNIMESPSCGHQAHQVVPGCWECAVQPVQRPGEAPEDVLDVPELRGSAVSDAIQELLHRMA